MELNINDIKVAKRFVGMPTHIIVIGCGGTGSMFIRDMLRIVSVVYKDRTKPHVLLCDQDSIEPKNLVRQNFIECDVNRNKAEVLADRYGSAFGIQVSYTDKYVESESGLDSLIKSLGILSPRSTVLIFSMVDNVKTRLMISNFMNGFESGSPVRKNYRSYDIVYVDAGNSEYSGQVCISATYTNIDKFFMPTVAELQPDLLDKKNWDKFASELSCEEAAVSDPQSISANATAANICMNVLYNILTKGYIHYSKVVFDSVNNTTVTTFLRDSDTIKTMSGIGVINY